MNLSKSKYCRGLLCKKMLWLDIFHPEYADDELVNQAVFDNGNVVGDVAMGYFGDFFEIPFSDNLNDMISLTNKKMKEGCNVIAEASFVYDDNFCSVDILKKNGDFYDIYEVKSSTEVKDIYREDVSYQYYVLTNLKLNIRNVYIMYVNSNYVRRGELNLKELFLLEDVTEYAKNRYEYVRDKICELKNIDDSVCDIDIDVYCDKPYTCIYKPYCQRCLSKPNVFDIASMSVSKKYNLYHKNLITFKDILSSDEKITSKQMDQLEIELSNDSIINKENIKSFLSTLSYPLYFLDFETFQQSIPMWDMVKPYMQIPFQYSLHFMNEKGGLLFHKEFLAKEGENPMRALALKLIEDIPGDVCVLAYNMSFEKSIIKRLAYMFPDLSDDLMKIYNNIKDLMIPFYNHDFYVKEMKGSYSIKYVLPALCGNDLNYKKLDEVHNGSEAMNAYLNLDKKSNEEIIKTRNNLLKYCELDTLAMVKILDKLYEVIDDEG